NGGRRRHAADFAALPFQSCAAALTGAAPPDARTPREARFTGRSCARGTRCKRRGPESNRRIAVLQTAALPLGYRADLGRLTPPPQTTQERREIYCSHPVLRGCARIAIPGRGS